MPNWWETKKEKETKPLPQAVAYYRHSAEIGQENSVEIQADQVRKWAKDSGIKIIQEFADHGKSGLSTDHRDAFKDMIENWVKKRKDFEYVLVLDVSRWGRFQDIDLSAQWSLECTKHGKQVIYTSIGIPKKDDPLYPVYLTFERYRAAKFSRELSEKVFNGCLKVAEQGFRPGGAPPFGFHRLMLDENKKPDRILQPGQRKGIQNGRIILVPGAPEQVAVIQEIFVLFVERKLDERQIAGQLNQRGIFSPGGIQWSEGSVRRVLANQQYAGAVVYNKTASKLTKKVTVVPREEWIITPGAYDPVVTPELFQQAQSIFEARKQRFSHEELLKRLKALYEKYECVTTRLLHVEPDVASSNTYVKRFGSMAGAFQQMFADVLCRTKNAIAREIGDTVQLIEHEDFLVLNKSLSVLIQPAVPRPNGYDWCWDFRPDQRNTVDITLCVPLGEGGSGDILGYLALPRLLVPQTEIRLSAD